VEKALWQRATVTLVVASSLSGCASSGGSWSSRLAYWRNDQPAGLAADVSPDFSKNYAANKVSPQRGDLPEPTGEMPQPQQSSWAKFSSAVSGSGNKAVKSVKSVFQRDPAEQINPDAGTKSAQWKDLDKPTGTNVYISLAEIMERSGNFEGAARQYELALKADKNLLPALLGSARLYDRQGKFAEAIEMYERASRAHPDEAAVYNDLALCLSRQGRKEDAAAKMQQAVKLQPDRKLYRNNMAKMLVDINEPDAALEQLTAAHPLAVAHYNLGYLLAQKGDPQRAAHHFARALEHDSSLSDARRWLDNLSSAAPAPQQPAHASGNPAPAPYGAGATGYGTAPAQGGSAPSAPYGPGAVPYGPRANVQPLPAGPDASVGPQWIEPQTSPSQGAHRPASAALPTVLRPDAIPPGPRYGMAPTGFEPPSQY
jgi:tetratricopeptide (TPR) repeat protein